MTARAFALDWFVRTALLLLWSLVAWGALLLLLTLVGAVSLPGLPWVRRR